MYISARTYRATTGPVEFSFDYVCAYCGANAAARVRTVGIDNFTALYGAEGGEHEARLAAEKAAWKLAVEAMTTVTCPRCGRLPSLAPIEEARARAEKQRGRKLRVAGIAAGSTSIVTMIPALADWHNSSLGLLCAVAMTLLVGAVIVFGFSWPPGTTAIHRRGDVWLYWGEPPNEPTWLLAPPPPTVAPIEDPSRARALSAFIAVVALSVVLLGSSLLRATFLRVWVVDVANSGALTVEIDGQRAGDVRSRAGTTSDVSYASFIVRSGREHRVVLVTATGTRQTFLLDAAADRKSGWIVAPDAAANDLCVVHAETVYTAYGAPSPPVPNLLAGDGGVIPLRRTMDDMFEPPPSRMSTDKGDVVRQTVRAVRCSALAHGLQVPFREGSGGVD